MKYILKGFLIGSIEICTKLNIDYLKDLYNQYSKLVSTVFQEMTHGQDKHGKYGLNRINCDFIYEIVTIFQKYQDKFKDCLNELEEEEDVK